MSRPNQNRSTTSHKFNTNIVPGDFDLRHVDTWAEPSLIFRLNDEQRAAMRKIFRINWPDIDLHMKRVSDCVVNGGAFNNQIRQAQNVRVVHELKLVDGAMVVNLCIATLHDRLSGEPYYVMPDPAGGEQQADGQGDLPTVVPARLTFTRTFPKDRLDDLFNMSKAFRLAMYALKLGIQAQEAGNEEVFKGMIESLDQAGNILRKGPRLTAKVAEVVGGKLRKETGAASGEVVDDSVDDVARKLIEAATGVDPGAGSGEPEAGAESDQSGANGSARRKKDRGAKKQQQPAVKLGSPEAEAVFANVVVAAPPNGSNGQTQE